MVTQIYTAPLKASYMPHQIGMPSPLATGKTPTEMLNADEEGKKRGQPEALAVVKEQAQTGTIGIHSIVTDFQNTMNALGVSAEVREEVTPYLQVIAHQAQKPAPSPALIKNNLRAASDTLDQFISTTLGQKSTVVREWVDALLLQPIEFKATTPIEVSPSLSAQKPLFKTGGEPNPGSLSASISQQSPLSPDDKAFIKQALADAKGTQALNQPEAALGHYQSILSRIGDTNYPELSGRVLFSMGRILDKAGLPDDARSYYQQAQSKLSLTHNPPLQAKVFKALGQLMEKQGNLAEAAQQYQLALDLDTAGGKETDAVVTLHRLAEVQAQQGHLEEAKQAWKEALAKAQPMDSPLTGTLLNKLGALHRQEGKRGRAFRYFKEALETATRQNNSGARQQSLQEIAALYLDIGNTDKAFYVLQAALNAPSEA